MLAGQFPVFDGQTALESCTQRPAIDIGGTDEDTALIIPGFFSVHGATGAAIDVYSGLHQLAAQASPAFHEMSLQTPAQVLQLTLWPDKSWQRR